MEFSGEKVISASQERVYDALHDPVVLRQALPGIQSLNKVEDDKYDLSATLKIGAFRPTFHGVVELYNQDRPSGYSLRGRADSANGIALGSAHVALAAIDADTTNLAYHISVELDGQLGNVEVLRLETTARTLTGEFFSRLQMILDGESVPRKDEIPADPEPVAPPEHLADAVKTVTPTYASTDATGGYVLAPQPSAPAGYEHLSTPSTSMETHSGPTAAALETDGFAGLPRRNRPVETTNSEGGIGRWIAVIIGLVLIAALLNNNF
ncbi:CoxG family protein [Acuticoccus sp. I52.16.1]|uniref:CoxG family protein n=1 Tax=Acuticoccus sp. I52.16.1 TaxID=2928472 RepID=UPI002112E914|nr:carbon monoxide dehydrogenase subunit G [Acuticoccus sp. I52.16.1]